jgi:intein/homing endonuclease
LKQNPLLPSENSLDVDPLEKEIIEEALRWVRNNQSLKICDGSYASPRISSEIPDCSMPMSFDHLKWCSFGCTFCVIAGTFISADGGRRPIEDLKRGDQVHSYNIQKGCVELDTVINTMKRNTNELLEITLENGATIAITPEHPVYVTGKGWVEAGKLSESDDILFIKRPGISFYKTIHNPMKDPVVAAKMAATLSAKYANGEMEKQRKAISESTKKTHAEGRWHITPEGSESISKRMTENNPMKDPVTAKKQGESMVQVWANGLMEGHPRPDMVAKWSGPQNPMKNLETRKGNLQKIIKSWIKNGRVSKGELLVGQSLTRLGLDFVHQYVIEGRKRDYILDFFIKDMNICIEYDGHSGHYQEKGIKNDAVRDAYILEHYGTRTIRIHRDEAFIGKENLENILERRLLS